MPNTARAIPKVEQWLAGYYRDEDGDDLEPVRERARGMREDVRRDGIPRVLAGTTLPGTLP
jgi:hypothetical protein